MKGTLGWVVRILLVVGAINWGLVGAFDWNLVTKIFGSGAFTNIIYVLVGLAGIWKLIDLFNKK